LSAPARSKGIGALLLWLSCAEVWARWRRQRVGHRYSRWVSPTSPIRFQWTVSCNSWNF